MQIPSPLEELHLPLFEEKKITVFIKRDDLIHPEISGNKWRKLKLNIEKAKSLNKNTILTFGGAYSNHIAATAAVGKLFNLKTIGIIRGEETLPLNPTIEQAKDAGMEIKYISRSEYKKKNENDYINKLTETHGDFYLIPEGGGNTEGVMGCKDIVTEIDVNFDYILTDCGTGATLAGIYTGLKANQKAIGIPVLKGGEFIKNELEYFLEKDFQSLKEKVILKCDYHFGGYAKYKPELIEFMRYFYLETGIKTDPIYTGKLFYAFQDLVYKDYFPEKSKIIIVHTGGLQGISGFEKRHNFDIYE